MIKEFAEDSRQDAHRQFQRWRRTHPTGCFVNPKNRTTYLLHTVLCPHAGGTEWGTDIGQSLARKKKICSPTIAELEAWASSHSFSLQRCHDCAPAEPAGDYIAYHSSEVTGQEYGTPTECFQFYSRKAESFLRRAIGCRVWVIASSRTGSHTNYQLAGMFTPSVIRREGDSFNIAGPGIPFRAPFEVTNLPWFAELLREQNRFSFGFNRIRSANIVAALQRLLKGHGGESVLQPEEVSVPSKFFEGATRQVFINSYERNPYARLQCIQHYGCQCSVCGFDFEAVYGELGSGFVHVHHLKPLSEIGEKYQIDPIGDLRPICPNCHAMIHRDTKMMSVDGLKKLIGSRLRQSNSKLAPKSAVTHPSK